MKRSRMLYPINKGYGDAGASWQKKATKGFRAMSGSPKEDIDANNATLRQRARMLYMAAPIATSAIKTNRTNVIGVGLRLKSRIDRRILDMDQAAADTWQKKTEREFALWANRKAACDATGVNNFYAMQQLALASWLVSGDVFAVIKQYDPTPTMPYSLRIHLVEADRVATPTANSSYSASRAALLEAWKAFKMRREWFVADFCAPIYEIWMAEAVARGRIDAPGFFTDPAIRAAYLGAEWIGPSQGQLDPVKEITAEILAVGEGFSTREQSTIRLNGGKWDANVEQITRENEKLSQAGEDPGRTAQQVTSPSKPKRPESPASPDGKTCPSLVCARR